jgi:hypothetical protein
MMTATAPRMINFLLDIYGTPKKDRIQKSEYRIQNNYHESTKLRKH